MLAFAQALRAWADRENILYQDLAKQLAMSPQSLSDVFSQRNSFTGNQILKAQELMSNPNDPNTLAKAKDRIDELNAEVARLKAAPPAVAVSAPLPQPPSKPAEIRETIIERKVPKAIADMSISELRLALNATRNPEMQQTLYAAIKAKQRAEKLPPYRR